MVKTGMPWLMVMIRQVKIHGVQITMMVFRAENRIRRQKALQNGLSNVRLLLLTMSIFAAGDTILIRFRLFSDPYAAGWGWAIDNLEIQRPVSVDNVLLSPGEINIYPNPFKNDITVNISGINNESTIQIELYNSLGQKVVLKDEHNIIGEYTGQINLSGYGSGMFLIKVKQNGHTVLTKKLIKN